METTTPDQSADVATGGDAVPDSFLCVCGMSLGEKIPVRFLDRSNLRLLQASPGRLERSPYRVCIDSSGKHIVIPEMASIDTVSMYHPRTAKVVSVISMKDPKAALHGDSGRVGAIESLDTGSAELLFSGDMTEGVPVMDSLAGRWVGLLPEAPKHVWSLKATREWSGADVFASGYDVGPVAKLVAIRQYDVERLRLVQRFGTEAAGHRKAVNMVDFGGGMLYSCSSDKWVYGWSRETPEPVLSHSFALGGEGGDAILVAPELSLVFVATSGAKIFVLDTRNLSPGPVAYFAPPNHCCNTYDLARVDRNKFVSVSSKGAVAMWNSMGKQLAHHEFPGGCVSGVRLYDPEGTALGSLTRKEIVQAFEERSVFLDSLRGSGLLDSRDCLRVGSVEITVRSCFLMCSKV